MTSRENDLFANLVPRAFPFEIEAGRLGTRLSIRVYANSLSATFHHPCHLLFLDRDYLRSNMEVISGPGSFPVQFGYHLRTRTDPACIPSGYQNCSKFSKSIFVLCLSVLRFTEAAVETNETRLYNDLFKDYNKYTLPVIDESTPVTIVFDFQLIRIIDVVSHIAWKFSSLSNTCALTNWSSRTEQKAGA